MVYLQQHSSTTTTANTITVTFNSAPAADAFIQIAGFNKSSSIAQEVLRASGTKQSHMMVTQTDTL